MHPAESLWEISDGAGTTGARAFANVFRTKADVGSGSYIGFTLTDKELGGGSWSRLGGVDNDYLRDDLGQRLEPNTSVFVKFSYWWRLWLGVLTPFRR